MRARRSILEVFPPIAIAAALALLGCGREGSGGAGGKKAGRVEATAEEGSRASVPESETLEEADTPPDGSEERATREAAPAPVSRTTAPPARLEVEDVQEGEGRPARPGDEVFIRYRATLLDGRVFAETPEGRSYRFLLGGGAVIRGLEEGIAGMQAGGRRRLTIPAHLAWGQRGIRDASGAYTVPPGASVVFDVDLLEIGDGRGR